MISVTVHRCFHAPKESRSSEEELFNELYADVLSDGPSDFEFSDSDSDDSDIRPSKRQRRILSDSEADSDEEWNDIDMFLLWKIIREIREYRTSNVIHQASLM
ncbi:hypothetical protein HNY73_000983 [Argiope bruennichi]|uniref:Uncharacterized protein n=1 Tax=Argiope bruennichi TaxID=94029 RepID=A0A8T0G438_ARGBR|nr:hypothetical protein HNY73_000983 [Argiope bruennichi]